MLGSVEFVPSHMSSDRTGLSFLAFLISNTLWFAYSLLQLPPFPSGETPQRCDLVPHLEPWSRSPRSVLSIRSVSALFVCGAAIFRGSSMRWSLQQILAGVPSAPVCGRPCRVLQGPGFWPCELDKQLRMQRR